MPIIMTSFFRIIAKPLAQISTAGMFVVLVMGATVTNTGSEHGCGKSWPLCHGQLIPQFALRTFIEFSHRAIVGVESVLIIALAIVGIVLHRDRLEMRILAPLMVFFLFLQAGLGAWAVMEPQLAAVLALHFGVSLMAFATVLLTSVFLFEFEGSDRLRDHPIPPSYRRFVWALTLYSYVVVYLGAFVRHVNADEACSGWPLCNGTLFPAATGKVGVNLTHRIAAAFLVAGIVWLVLWSRKLRSSRPDLYRAAHLAFGFVVLQALSGAFVEWTRLDLFSALAHAAMVGLMFGSLTYLCVHVLPRSVPQTRSARRPFTTATTSGE